VQTELALRTWGGRRENAGRKPGSVRPGVPHSRREPLPRNVAVHVTMRAREGLPRLRTHRGWQALRAAVRGVLGREGLRVCELSLMTNHVHLIVEADDRLALSGGMNALGTSLAKRINRVLGRSGRVFAGRYHARVLKTPLEVKRALAYVLNNARKHAAQGGRRLAQGWLDPFSSARAFTGWRDIAARAGTEPQWLARAATWLLRVGWRRHGAIDVDAIPGPAG
jgi:REP element-mobilizing transposase RayT